MDAASSRGYSRAAGSDAASQSSVHIVAGHLHPAMSNEEAGQALRCEPQVDPDSKVNGGGGWLAVNGGAACFRRIGVGESFEDRGRCPQLHDAVSVMFSDGGASQPAERAADMEDEPAVLRSRLISGDEGNVEVIGCASKREFRRLKRKAYQRGWYQKKKMGSNRDPCVSAVLPPRSSSGDEDNVHVIGCACERELRRLKRIEYQRYWYHKKKAGSNRAPFVSAGLPSRSNSRGASQPAVASGGAAQPALQELVDEILQLGHIPMQSNNASVEEKCLAVRLIKACKAGSLTREQVAALDKLLQASKTRSGQRNSETLVDEILQLGHIPTQ